MDFKGAGILFTNNNLFLCGYQPNKKVPIISGIGGKKELNETIIQTAMRETVEELFDIKINLILIDEINKHLIYKKLLYSNNYYTLIYSFDDLEILLNILNKLIKSDLYELFPLNISDLIFKRKSKLISEISNLCLLPLEKDLLIDSELIHDINSYLDNFSNLSLT